MKLLLITALAVGTCAPAFAQIKEGKIIFERTIQLQIRLSDDHGGGMENALPQNRKDRFELSFANNQTLWKMAEQDMEDDGGSFNSSTTGGGGVQIRMFGMGSEDVTYNNFDNAQRVGLRELGTKKFIVEDSVDHLNWKLAEETKTILGHVCRKAVAERIGIRTMMNMDNGKMERKEIADTSIIVAWYAIDIPVPGGPADYEGQLPGMVLAVDIANGRQSFVAVEISPKVDIASIKAPKGPKRITRAEFARERQKMLDEMQRNSGGPGRQIRISN